MFEPVKELLDSKTVVNVGLTEVLDLRSGLYRLFKYYRRCAAGYALRRKAIAYIPLYMVVQSRRIYEYISRLPVLTEVREGEEDCVVVLDIHAVHIQFREAVHGVRILQLA